MNIQTFIERINELAPSSEEFFYRYKDTEGMDLELAKDLSNEYLISYHKVTDRKDDILYDLIYNTNISSKTIGHIYFHPEIRIYDEIYRCFARYNDAYYLVHNTITNEIESYYRDDGTINCQCGTDISVFLEALILYQMVYIESVDRKKDIRKEDIDQIKKIVGGEEYFEFFKDMLELLVGIGNVE